MYGMYPFLACGDDRWRLILPHPSFRLFFPSDHRSSLVPSPHPSFRLFCTAGERPSSSSTDRRLHTKQRKQANDIFIKGAVDDRGTG